MDRALVPGLRLILAREKNKPLGCLSLSNLGLQNLRNMQLMILLIGFVLLFLLCWPLALLALVLFPVVWLISLPLRLVGITIGALFALFRALMFLPARLLGWRRS